MKKVKQDQSTTPMRSPREPKDPEREALVTEIIGEVADKWTMLALEALEEHGRMRFTELAADLTGISPKMLTKTLRQMECDGLLWRTVFPVIPPRVEYELTPLGRTLGAAFCRVWEWALKNREEIEAARNRFSQRIETTKPWQTRQS